MFCSKFDQIISLLDSISPPSLFYLKCFLPSFQRPALGMIFYFSFGVAWVGGTPQCRHKAENATQFCSAGAVRAKQL